MSSPVQIKVADQPRVFAFGPLNLPTIVNGASNPMYKEAVYTSYQAILKGTAPTATVAIQVSNDDNTGRGFTAVGKTAPGFPMGITNASAAVTSPGADFTAAMTGAVVIAPGVPAGTTFTFVTPQTGTLSANATGATGTVGAVLYDVNWNTTALGTITLAAAGCDGFSVAAAWRYVRALVTNIGGVVTSLTIIQQA